MIDPIFAGSAFINAVLSFGFTLYCCKVISHFSFRTKIGRAWVPMLIGGIFMSAIGVLVFGQALGLAPDLPVWWREPIAAVTRVWLFIGIIVIFRSWKKLGT